jgi:hypothetical protein
MTTSMVLSRIYDLGPYYLGHEDVKDLVKEGYDPYLLSIRMAGTTGGTTPAEIDAPDNVFDGTTTAAKVWVVSASANDNDIAAGHCREVKIIGIRDIVKSDPYGTSLGSQQVVSQEVISMAGVTPVESEYAWRRIFHFSCYSYGTGGADAAGEIVLTDDAAGTTTYHTIDAGATEGNGAAIWFPLNQKGVIINGHAAMTTMTGVTTNNVILRKQYSSELTNQTDEDLAHDDLVAYWSRKQLGMVCTSNFLDE